ncbi:antitoxin [uncultured Nocardioides sp.]|uniref:antitoxin n=1 Tax=uncultured Nocardioides sp. TaxID=198441 RepID=UPI0026035628|nr:antitoxin [uncultured Nocardioides sp.]
MGFLDKAKKQLTDAVDKHGDKIGDGLDRVAAEADKRTGGKHTDKIEQGVAKAKDGLDRLDGRNDDIADDK